MARLRLAHGSFAASVYASFGFLPVTNPPWPPTYNMSMSTLTMQCNSSGFSSSERGAQFGIVSYDWSNAKADWAATKPMDCEERLLKQAEMTAALNPDTHVFVYRNLVKALPWYTAVREKLDDPAYSGFFLKFDESKKTYHVPPCAAENKSKCSVFYHDQEQTPSVAGGDGKCTDNVCDCGSQPCGEYLWDHRNGSMLRNFLVNEFVLGPTGLGSPAIQGLFMDDFWCSNKICEENPHVLGCPCNDPAQGPTEEDKHSQEDMGLSDEDVRDITLSWNKTMDAVEEALLKHKGYSWWLMDGQANSNASPTKLQKSTCTAQLREACTSDSPWQKVPRLFGLTVNATSPLQLKQDVAFFLLARGPYTWLGWGIWGMTWPFNAEPAHGELPPLPHGVPRPREIDEDYGTPTQLCHETSPGSNVFMRKWTKATVSLDCSTFSAHIEMETLSVVV